MDRRASAPGAVSDTVGPAVSPVEWPPRLASTGSLRSRSRLARVKSASTTLPVFAVPDGFEEEDLREGQQAQITIHMDFANFADYWEFTRRVPWLPGLLDGLPSEWHQRVCSAVESAFLVGEADGPRSLAATAS